MTTMQISATETGVTRVFHLDLPAPAVARFTEQAGTGEWPLKYGLGAKKLRPAFVEVVAIRDLDTMPLSTYLAEGYGLTGKDFKATRPQLDALRGHVVILPSQAFDATEQTLTIASPLRWVATFAEDQRPAELAPLRSASAAGILSGGGPAGAQPAKGSTRLARAMAAAVAIVVFAIVIYALVP